MQTLPDWMPSLAIILAGRVQKGALESGSWDAKVIVVSVGPVSMMHNGACGVLGCLRSSETDVRVLAIQASKQGRIQEIKIGGAGLTHQHMSYSQTMAT